ncbi:MAG TPA: hypothetical protein VK348_00935 [Planctomycetota bacterium]|nr:hypothetical protein [Planctomycetota bacterium]
MTAHDDWLWDGSGAAESQLAALQRALAPLAHDGRPLQLPGSASPRRPVRRLWYLLAAAAAVAAVLLPLWWSSTGLQPGSSARTFVAAAKASEIRLGELATITLQPGSRLQFLHWRSDQALFRLDAGGIEARVLPPPAVQPAFFQVDTSVGRCVDQGCRYELLLDEKGRAHVHVKEGAVTFAFPGRELFVPAGAGTVVTPGGGPSLPTFTGTDVQVRKLAALFEQLTPKATPALRQEAAKELVGACRVNRDSLLLYHLLLDDDAEIRSMAESRLFDVVGPPPGHDGKKGFEHAEPSEWLPYLRIHAW